MDIYADLPSANSAPDSTKASASGAQSSSSSTASKGWAHSKFQGMIAKRRTATAAVSFYGCSFLRANRGVLGGSVRLLPRGSANILVTKTSAAAAAQQYDRIVL